MPTVQTALSFRCLGVSGGFLAGGVLKPLRESACNVQQSSNCAHPVQDSWLSEETSYTYTR